MRIATGIRTIVAASKRAITAKPPASPKYQGIMTGWLTEKINTKTAIPENLRSPPVK